MTLPYTAKIMACLAGHTPIELARFTRRMYPSDVRAVTGEISRDWELWGEYPLADKHTMTSRPKIKHKHTGNDAFHLTAEEKAGLK